MVVGSKSFKGHCILRTCMPDVLQIEPAARSTSMLKIVVPLSLKMSAKPRQVSINHDVAGCLQRNDINLVLCQK
jgi:hypothetical protein